MRASTLDVPTAKKGPHVKCLLLKSIGIVVFGIHPPAHTEANRGGGGGVPRVY